jgi:hypothetical protein
MGIFSNNNLHSMSKAVEVFVRHFREKGLSSISRQINFGNPEGCQICAYRGGS